eukprot:2226545-Alexandrium_andersonii.AAC.1
MRGRPLPRTAGEAAGGRRGQRALRSDGDPRSPALQWLRHPAGCQHTAADKRPHRSRGTRARNRPRPRVATTV